MAGKKTISSSKTKKRKKKPECKGVKKLSKECRKGGPFEFLGENIVLLLIIVGIAAAIFFGIWFGVWIDYVFNTTVIDSIDFGAVRPWHFFTESHFLTLQWLHNKPAFFGFLTLTTVLTFGLSVLAAWLDDKNK